MELSFSQKHIASFEKMGILAIYLFGSRAQGNTHPLSDVDIGVIFEKPEQYKNPASGENLSSRFTRSKNKTMEPYSALYDIFTDVLPKEYLQKRFELKEHEVDIVFLQFAPLNLQFEATRNGKILYEEDIEKRLDYEEYVLKKNCDLKYFYDLRYNAILERI